ncbi:MAG: GreA/GreB family elongation factor [Candidatus Shikimatogenerans bostrichidophilus]|nr:MAG: GreA/GreB family elongation factor [Candidatus Shikimatogenerans bostrichidophilus]
MEYITKKCFKQLKKKLFLLENNIKTKIINQMTKALEKGDLSENYEYISAKESYQLLEIKINKLKNILLNSKIINEKNKKKNRIYMFSIVTIKNLKNNKINKYTIVSNTEANIKQNKISINSPISLSLIGKKIGDIIKFPNTKIKYKIINIE